MTPEALIADPRAVHVVSVSGGKDSTATYCTALEVLGPTGFRAVAADTGNEHPATYEQVNRLHEWTGGPRVEWVRADFTHRIASKRAHIAAHWDKPRGDKPAVPPERIAAALAILDERLANPEDANPYLDMCLWKGRFPSRKAQFCTEALKIEPIDQEVTRPLLADGLRVVSWQGVRAAESLERSLLEPVQRIVSHDDLPGELWVYRPLLSVSSVDDVFAIGARHGVPPNPLYGWGLSRVGCFPCINCAKDELRIVDDFHPAQIDRLERWERLVSPVSRRGSATFFYAHNDPVVAHEASYFASLGAPITITAEDHGIRSMVRWAKTDRGGRQLNMLPTPAPHCAAHGACE